MPEFSEPKNAVDIAASFVNTLNDCRIGNVQLFGGVGSFALSHPDVQISSQDKTITAPGDLYLPQYRDDGNRRDLDCLVLSTDADEVREVKTIAEAVVGDELELSVFGLKSLEQLKRRRQFLPLGLVKMIMSDRYVIEDTVGIVEATKSTLIADAAMPPSCLESWQLKIGDDHPAFPVPHPGATILNYLTRSISGLRPKDVSKVHNLTANVAAKAREIIDWITDGDGQEQLELARILHTLRESDNTSRAINVGGVLKVDAYDLGSLKRREDLAISSRPILREGLVDIEHAISQLLFFAEKRPRTVTAWQKHVEPHIKLILGNQ
jgi:hypothetical protein